jgi:phosphoglycolate phosphatase-like HAD superfamily hydrolase
MRRLTSALAVGLFACLAATSHAQTVDRVTGWRSDLSFWLDQLRKQHYVYKSKPLPPPLLKAADELSKNIPKYSDERVLFEMQRLAAYIGDGHTYVLPLGAERVHGSVIPIRFYLFSDGLFVIDAQPGYEKWIGGKLVSIGNTPAAVILERMKPAISADNPFGYKWIGPPFLNLRGAIESLTDGSDVDSIRVTLRTRSGVVQKLKFATVPPPRMQGVPKLMASKLSKMTAPLWLTDVSRNFWMKSVAPGTLYVQFNQVMDEPSHTLKQAGTELDSALADRTTTKIILDVRHNNGGNSYLYPPIIDALTKWEAANPKGKLYVLTGRNTFSAAQNFIAQLDKRTRAIFVGEPSSSKPNFVGEENDIQLPWSGAIASISNRYHENIPGDKRGWIEPDIRIELSSTDYFANRDPVLRKVLKH